MDFRDKIIPFANVAAWRGQLRSAGKKLVVTNGCFDILHALVGLNSDASVRALKGAGRPVNSESDRATVLAALAAVDGVCLFEEVDALRLLAEVKPDIYAKGGDYTLDTINQPERRLIEAAGGKVVILPGVPGRSTSNVLAKIAKG